MTILGNGIMVHAVPHLCEEEHLRRLGPARTHRRARIRRKWLKRYGYRHRPCSGVAFKMAGAITACPCVVAQLRARYGAA